MSEALQDVNPANLQDRGVQGAVIFVGAGPGNPDLLTVRAREVLSQHEYAVVDQGVLPGVTAVVGSALAVPEEKLKAAEQAYEELCAQAKAQGAKRKPPRPAPPTAAELHTVSAETVGDVADLLAALSQHGKPVIRLVQGNPLADDRTLAEINEVTRRGMEFHIVPGMSLPATVPMFAGIALGSSFTETDLSQGEVDWDQLAAAPQPLVLQASRDDLAAIAEELTSRGIAGDTSATVTAYGTTRLQRSFDVEVAQLPRLDVDLSPTVVVTIGRAVDERTKYSWWENRPLFGWRVLVPRAKDQAGPMSARLASHGAIPQEVPTISVEPPRNPAQLERAIKGVVEGRYQWVVFTSVNAVKAVWEKIRDFGLDARAFAGVRIAAVGTKTAEAVRELGITPELLPPQTRQNAAGLVEVFPDFVEELDPVSRVLLPRADIATEVLVEGLAQAGWEVDDVTAYRTVRAAPPSAEVRDMIKTGGFDAVCFTSASTVRNLVGIAGKPHQRTIIACIGPMAKAAAEEAGLRVDVVPEVADVPSLVDALAEHVAHLRAAGQLPPPRKKRRARKQV
ncbi:uroporphyrinogen-III synthase [Corynebacterium gerontici]|uniref:Siroheme synthase n=1 Tax=Corynebacterium gerontici TaxID=2079234 RepID=A0A3G6J2U3_9CORY|nr:uroporphyrinogen-III synthase [Corynebacterium gerontici]AZA12226.1 Siroheme synthase [Corynebacterium gerontici]